MSMGQTCSISLATKFVLLYVIATGIAYLQHSVLHYDFLLMLCIDVKLQCVHAPSTQIFQFSAE